MSSSSSSSASGKKGKKKKAGKKEKKDKKKEKKGKKDKKDKKAGKKDDEKERKRAERAEAWNCERGDAVKQIGSLLQLDATIEAELEPVFEAIDSGETVRLDGLANKQARKKLRHLLQAFRLVQEDGGQAYRSAELKVSFSSIFRICLAKAKEHYVPAAEPVEEEPPPPAVAAPERAVPKAPLDPRAGFAGEEDEEGLVAPAAPPSPKKPRLKGPQLPGASVGAVAGGDSGSESDAEAGPRGEGDERAGVDLDNIVEIESLREEWMTMAPESMAGLFVDGNGMVRGKKADAYAVKRSKEEQEAFEKAFKERGPSLLSQQQDGAFADAKEDQDKMRKRKVGASDVWGMSSKQQERQAMRPDGGVSAAPRKAFDPEKDMDVKKPMTSDQFTKLVENSQEGLAGRFSRGGVASSFL